MEQRGNESGCMLFIQHRCYPRLQNQTIIISVFLTNTMNGCGTKRITLCAQNRRASFVLTRTKANCYLLLIFLCFYLYKMAIMSANACLEKKFEYNHGHHLVLVCVCGFKYLRQRFRGWAASSFTEAFDTAKSYR